MKKVISNLSLVGLILVVVITLWITQSKPSKPDDNKNVETKIEETEDQNKIDNQELKKIEVSSNHLTINVGKSEKINVINESNINWSSKDINIATVDNNGVVTGIKAGKTHIIVSSPNKQETIIEVTVVDEPIKVTGIKVKNNNIALKVDDKAILEYEIIPNDAINKKVIITSSNRNIVSLNGIEIIAKGEGEATITITTDDGGYNAQIRVKVMKPSSNNNNNNNSNSNNDSNSNENIPILSGNIVNNSYFKITPGKNVSKSVADQNRIGINMAIEYAKEKNIKNLKLAKDYYVININEEKTTHYGIEIRNSNFKFDLNGSTIKLYTNNYGKYRMIMISGAHNVKVYNGELIGDLQTHKCGANGETFNLNSCKKNKQPSDKLQMCADGTTHQTGYGILVASNCRNITISDMKIHEMIGDGVTIADTGCKLKKVNGSLKLDETDCPARSNSITVKNSEIYNCRRQGISIISAKNTKILNNKIHDICGTDPGEAIDIEPNNKSISKYKAGDTYQIVRGVRIDGNEFYNTAADYPYTIKCRGHCNDVKGTITITNNKMDMGINICKYNKDDSHAVANGTKAELVISGNKKIGGGSLNNNYKFCSRSQWENLD